MTLLPARLLARLFALPLLAAGACAQNAPQGGPAAGPLRAEVFQVKSAPFAQTLATVGTLRANESVTLVPEISRRLVKIKVQEGSSVAAGDLLFKLDDSDLTAELGEIEARLKLATINKERADSLMSTKAISRQGRALCSVRSNFTWRIRRLPAAWRCRLCR